MAQQSHLSFIIESCGLWYAVLIPVVALVSFALTLLLVTFGRDSLTGPALVLIVPMPALVGFYASISGMLSSMMVIAATELAIKPSEWYAGFAASLVTTWLGLLIMAPAFLTAVLGLSVRALKPAQPQSHA